MDTEISTVSVDRAKSAYHAYGSITDFKNYQGKPMPEWDALTDTIKSAWEAAANDAAGFAIQAVPEPVVVEEIDPAKRLSDIADRYITIAKVIIDKLPSERFDTVFAAVINSHLNY